MSPRFCRYFAGALAPSASPRVEKCDACSSSSSIASTHWTTSAPSIDAGNMPGTRCTPSSTIDQPDDRQIELLEVAVTAQPLDRTAARLSTEQLARELLDALEGGGLHAAGVEVELDPPGELVCRNGPHPGRHERARHQTLRVGRSLVPPEGQGLGMPAFGHATSVRSSSSRSNCPGSGSTSLSAKTTSTPRREASSATTSMAAALISTR